MEPTADNAFLVYHDGLMLAHRARAGDRDYDADLLTGMLTVIQDFVTHSMKSLGDMEVKNINFGDKQLSIERGSRVYLAVLYDGDYSKELSGTMQGVVGSIEKAHWNVLDDWNGDFHDVSGLDAYLGPLFGETANDSLAAGGQNEPYMLGGEMIRQGTNLIVTTDEEVEYHIFRHLTMDRPGLCVSRRAPGDIAKVLNPAKVRHIRLSEEGGLDIVDPKEMNKDLLRLMLKFVQYNDQAVMLLDDLEFLIEVNGLEKVRSFFMVLGTLSPLRKKGVTLLSTIDPGHLGGAELIKLRTVFDKVHEYYING